MSLVSSVSEIIVPRYNDLIVGVYTVNVIGSLELNFWVKFIEDDIVTYWTWELQV